MNIHVLIINDGRPGHVNQSFGIVESLKKERSITEEVVDISYRLKALRPLINFFVKRNSYLGDILNLCLVKYSKKIDVRPDLIVSSGGYTCASSVLLARTFQTKNIFLGTPKGYSLADFSLVISSASLGAEKNNLVVDVMPQRFDKVGMRAAAREFLTERRLNSNYVYWSLLIGGPTHYYKYTKKDWEELVVAMNELAEKYSVKWLVSTSRRTPAKVEETLSLLLRSNPSITYSVFYNQKPEKCLPAFLGLSSYAFVTEDSTSMLSEVVAAGLPLVSLHSEMIGEPDGGHLQLVQRLSNMGSMKRMCIGDILQTFQPVKLKANKDQSLIPNIILNELGL